MTHSQIYYQRFKSPEQRFWEKVNKDGPIPQHAPELGKCWDWIAYREDGWHGRMGRINGKKEWPHRFSYKIHCGEIDSGLFVLHKCDNPICVNPSHLFLGTQRDNIDDMMKKGRQVRGEQKKMAKLTDEKVIEMRKIYADGVLSIRKIAKMFGVDHGNAGKIIRRQAWKHVS